MEMRMVLLALVLLMTACTTSGSGDEVKNNRKAAETNTSLGQGYIQREEYEIALDKLKRALAYDKTYAPAHTMLGVLYEILGDLEQAEEEYANAVKYDASGGEVNNNYGVFLCRIGHSSSSSGSTSSSSSSSRCCSSSSSSSSSSTSSSSSSSSSSVVGTSTSASASTSTSASSSSSSSRY